ncbi:MAG TPA: FAD-binding protein, partial [Candidatus Limnocylindria bacterium]|nr:FAD-binding protein [Candidatus Limnocylindria bacterium]
MRIKNFGRNVVFTAKHFYQPHSEAEVLEILNKHSRGQIRVVGSLHAWNDGIVSDDALLDIKYLNNVQITQEGEQAYANVGGGCKLEWLIKILATQNLTVPAMGGIMRQTIAGLASTATHGTGRSSFSHYITEIRIAAYDETTG